MLIAIEASGGEEDEQHKKKRILDFEFTTFLLPLMEGENHVFNLYGKNKKNGDEKDGNFTTLILLLFLSLCRFVLFSVFASYCLPFLDEFSLSLFSCPRCNLYLRNE